MKKLALGFFSWLLFATTVAAAIPPIPPPAAYNPGFFPIARYGARCNGQQSLAITTTATSPTISGPFTARDTGKAIAVFAGASTSLTGGITTLNSRNMQVASTAGLVPGMEIDGPNIPAGSYVKGLFGSLTFEISQPATGSASGQAFTAHKVLATTISSASSGSATLAANAVSSLAGNGWAFWGTDDTTAIQAAETAAVAAGGGMVALPNGNCVTSATVNWDGKVAFNGNGPGQSLWTWISSADQTSPVVQTTNSGTCTYASGLNYQDMQFTNIGIEQLFATQASYNVSGKGISAFCAVRSRVSNVVVRNSPATCIATDAGMPTMVTDFVVENCGRLVGTGAGGNGVGEGLAGISQESYIIANGQVLNPGHYGVFYEAQTSSTAPATAITSGVIVYEGSNSQLASGGGGAAFGNSGGIGMVFTGNTAYGTTNSIKLWGCFSQDGGTLSRKSGVQSQFVGNRCALTGTGIQVNYSNVAASSNANTLIASNSVQGITLGPCIALTASGTGADTTLANITLKGNQGFGCASAGLLITGTATAFNISSNDNDFYDNGVVAGTTDYQKAGIAIGTNVNGLQITGGHLYDDGAATQKYGLSVNTGAAVTNGQIASVNMATNTTSVFDMLGTFTGILTGNTGLPAPTITGCSATGAVGNGDIGTYASGTTGTCTVVVTPYGTANILAPNGYVGNANDLTTSADTQDQSASTTTTATFKGTTVSGDIVNFQMRGW